VDPAGDRDLLRKHGWNLVDPHKIASTPETYRKYIQRSRAEFLCPKPIHVEWNTGWFSERSAAYLATGRPVLATNAGFSWLPTGRGLFVFRDIREAAAAVAEIDSNYELHSRAAREIAEAHLNSRSCLQDMIAGSSS
jgi:glycosyltransferase involved in cell wall biosynthesis